MRKHLTSSPSVEDYFQGLFIPQPSGPIIEVGEVGPEGRKSPGERGMDAGECDTVIEEDMGGH